MRIRLSTMIFSIIILASFLSSIYALPEIEPGIGFSTATELKTGTYSFYMEGTRSHFFKVWLNTNQIIHITLRIPPDVDIDMYLVSPEREVIERSMFARGFSERISYLASSQGYYYVVIVPFLGSSGLYTINILVVDPPTRTVTETRTEIVPVYETISKPTFIVNTVTKIVYETVTATHIEYVERFPWIFLGLTILAVSIIISSGMLLGILKSIRDETSQQTSS